MNNNFSIQVIGCECRCLFVRDEGVLVNDAVDIYICKMVILISPIRMLEYFLACRKNWQLKRLTGGSWASVPDARQAQITMMIPSLVTKVDFLALTTASPSLKSVRP